MPEIIQAIRPGMAASALVLFMTPGLAFFYAGFVAARTCSAQSCSPSS